MAAEKIGEKVPSGEVEVRRGGSEITMRAPHEVEHKAAADFVRAAKQNVTESAEDASLAIIDRILTASTLDEILSPATVTKAGEMVGIPFDLTNVRYMESDYDQGLPFYMLLTAKLHGTGDEVVVSCGAQSVMAQAYRMRELNLLPAPVVIMRSEKPTHNNYYPLHLEQAPGSVREPRVDIDPGLSAAGVDDQQDPF